MEHPSALHEVSNTEPATTNYNPSGDPVKDVLHQVFGHHAFRKGQEEAIQVTMSGRDAVIVMPTGGGKTMCYTIPAIVSKGVTIVVTPLLSLMDDQVQRLRQLRVSVAYFNSTMPEDEKERVLHSLSQKDVPYDILITTPEALLTPQFEVVIQAM